MILETEQKIGLAISEAPACVRLKAARTRKNISLQKVHEKSGIAMHHLEALEKCEFHVLPQGAARRTIMRQYAEAIGLSDEEFGVCVQEVCPKDAILKTPPTYHRFAWLAPSNWRSFLLSAAAIIVMLYLAFEVRAMIAPPPLNIAFPSDNFETHESTVSLRGITAPESLVTVNGVRLAVGRDGAFTESIHLKEGVNEIVVVSQSKRGGQAHVSRSVFFSP